MMKRSVLRSCFSKQLKQLEEVLSSEKADFIDVRARFAALAERYEQLKIADGNQIEAISPDDDEALIAELEKCSEYELNYLRIKERVQRLELNDVASSVGCRSGATTSPHHLRYPKLELKKFSGDVKDWLGFWNQFGKIHNDEHLNDSEKFEYLLQCLINDSPAQKLIANFPPSEGSYVKAIDLLKSRFGRDEFLIEYYVRELLSLVLTKNTRSLSNLYDSLEAHLRALESLGVTSSKYAAMLLLPLVESALPESVFKIWDRHRVSKQKSAKEPAECLTELLTFLRVEVEGDERLKLREGSFENKKGETIDNRNSPKLKKTNLNTSPTLVSSIKGPVKEQCIFCEKSTHSSQDCAIAADASLNDRNETIKKKGACFRCLLKGHLSSRCKVFVKCPVCKGRHYALMCPGIQVAQNSISPKKSSDVTLISTVDSDFSTTYLQTLTADIINPEGVEHRVRIMCDSGSQRSYILKSCAMISKLKPVGKMNVSQELFGGRQTRLTSHDIFMISLRGPNSGKTFTVNVLDSDKICECAPRLCDPKIFMTLKNKGIYLTDFKRENHGSSNEIQVLLGADAWAQLITPEYVTLSDQLVAVKTVLGWTLVGSVPENRNWASTTLVSLTSTARLPDLWELETLGIKDPGEQMKKDEKDNLVIDFFNETVRRDDSGRYIVNLPWIEGRPELETNYTSAVHRLLNTTRNLRRIRKFDDYDEAIKNWISQGIVERVVETEEKGSHHYLPHRAVFKESGTTKTRPVFDASNKDRNKNSLNTCLATGPNLIDLLPFVLTGFRKHEIGIVADIEKAFLQIVVDEKDRDMLRFLWWEGKEMITLRHQRVVFGVCCSPFLLAAVLRHLLNHPQEHLVEVANRLKNSFYVDNCLTGVSEESEIDPFIHEAQELLKSGGFNLREWVHRFNASEEKLESVLGLLWHCHTDTLRCSIPNLPVGKITRRFVLSTVQKVFDPLGLVAPATLLPKVILQQSWKLKLDWDECLPDDSIDEFKAWIEQLSVLEDCRIPRRICMNKSSTLHVFVDASQYGLGVCIFLRTEVEDGVDISLILAKSRVTPLKQLTLPRLELMAAVIGVRLYLLAKRCLSNDHLRTFFWSDSAVMLAWLSREGPWAVFVENRVREITSITETGTWHHVPGKLNPADLLSRGCYPSQLLKGKWWEGPAWLQGNQDSWPKSYPVPEMEELNKERRRTVVTAKNVVVDTVLGQLINRFSVYSKIVRTVAWILRLRPKSFRVHPDHTIDSEEFAKAEKTLLLWVQHDAFGFDKRKTQDLKNLDAYYDEDGLLRMKTRVLGEEGTEEYNFPIILPANHSVVERMIQQSHITHRHAGTLTLLVLLREKVWILQGRRAVGKIVNKCVTCRRQRVRAMETTIPPLPKDRTGIVNAFQVTGTDLAGPIVLKGGEKSWIVVFTCAVYRAVHLELITSLSSMAFMQSLRRFVARRGRMDVIYSDNGTNFVGLNKAMSQLDWDEIEKFCGLMKIRWKFNPPTASWWGGFWERLIRMLKDLLKKNLKNASLDYEELVTLLCECEFLMNNRPLTYVSEDGNELQPLRPSMFVQNLQGNETIDLDQIQASSLVKRWKYLQTVREHLRTRFKKEYLGFLRSNVHPQRGSVAVGDVVLVGQDNQKRSDWALGRVVELLEGKDQTVRLVKVRTATGIHLRPVQRLYPLEIRHEEGSSLMEDHSGRDTEDVQAPPQEEDSLTTDVEEDDGQQTVTRSGRIVKPKIKFDV